MNLMKDYPTDIFCLFCSSTLLPRSQTSSEIKFPKWTTPCCLEPICDKCLTRNPRLLYYNPCLKCLSGVSALNTYRGFPLTSRVVEPKSDGHFIIADDESGSEDDEDRASDLRSCTSPHGKPSDPPPTHEGPRNRNDTLNYCGGSAVRRDGPPAPLEAVKGSKLSMEHNYRQNESDQKPPISTMKYYIKPKDTLMGIAFKMGVDVSIA